MKKAQDLLSRRPLAGAVIAFVAGAVLAGVIVAIVSASEVSSVSDERDAKEQQLADTSEQLAQAEDERDQADNTADRITAQRDQILDDARAKASQMVGDAKDQLSDLNAQLSDAKSSLSSTQAKLDSTQASLDQAKETEAMSSFGNGTWQSGVDYIPGTYSAPGGGGCYWEKLEGPSGGGLNNIIDNGGFDKNQIVSVDSPYFHTSGCGTWTLDG